MDIIDNIYSYIDFYELPHIYGKHFTQSVVLSTNMYEMPLIYHNNHFPDQPMNGQLMDHQLITQLDPQLALNPLKDLKSRQELLLKRIRVLEEALDSDTKPQSSQRSAAPKTDTKKKSTPSSTVGGSGQVKATSLPVGSGDKAAISSLVGCGAKDMVITCGVSQLVVSVLSVIKQMKNFGVKILTKFYFHSTLNGTSDSQSDELNKILSSLEFDNNCDESGVEKRLESDLIFSFIFKDTTEPQMVIDSNQSTRLSSDSNILRFVAKTAAKLRPELRSLAEPYL